MAPAELPADQLEDKLDLEAYLAPFRLTAFRPGQREVIATVLADKDCLCVMPTGGGKSLCYQLPAIIRPGVTLVVSPLIALMKDQVDQLTALGLRATFINSTLTPDEQYARLDAMAAGQYDLVYVVPERFRSGRFLDAVRRSQLRLLAIDEAHCVSEWGHDFRPDYAKLGRFRAQLGNPPTIALTATATTSVRRDIVQLLNLREPESFVTGFARPNLHYEVACPYTNRDKDEKLIAFLKEHPGSGIVYASTRKRCEEVAQTIADRTKRKVGVYHAGLLPDDRRSAQEAFMAGRAEIVVATLAFGMGIDKSNVRFVAHYNLPGSLEAYYQEAGRAGRDGEPAHCLLLFSAGDRYLHEFFIESANPSRMVVEQVYNYFCEQEQTPIEMTQQQVKEALGLQIGNEGVGACEKILEQVGGIERLESVENMAAARINSDLPSLLDYLPSQAKTKRKVLRAMENIVRDQRREWVYFQPRELIARTELEAATVSRCLRELSTLESFDYIPPFRGRAVHVPDRLRSFNSLEIDFDTLERRKAAEYERLDVVIRFAQSRSCRQAEILRYFGETNLEACQHCDNCATRGPKPAGKISAPASAKLLEVVRIVLSGVARSRGRCGKGLIAQMLCGSASEKVTRNRLDKLSTYGLLAYLRQTEVTELIDALIAVGYLAQTDIDRFRPVLEVSASGAEVMGGRAELGRDLPLSAALFEKLRRVGGGGNAATVGSTAQTVAAKPAPTSGAAAADVNAPKAAPPNKLNQPTTPKVFEETAPAVKPTGAPANGAGNSAPSLFDAIDDPEETEPTTFFAAEEMAGPSEAFGKKPRVVGKVNGDTASKAPPTEFTSQGSISQAPAPAELSPVGIKDSRQTGQPQPSHYWTWRMLAAGFTPEECAVVRALPRDVILDHALRAADDGFSVEAKWFLTPRLLSKMEKVVGAETPPRIRPLLAKLPSGTRYEEVQLFLKCRQVAAAAAEIS